MTDAVDTPAAMAAWSDAARARGARIAFVPTMGALHEGHLELVRQARAYGDRVVVSIFVNPAQFGPKEDFARYPRVLDADLARLRPAGVDAVFTPSEAAVYPDGYQTYVQVRDVEKGLCGDFRPGHFVGVATVVLKLFNLVRPHAALFGEKDYQQLAVIRRMILDLALPVAIVGVPTVRDADGLALSSRNAYLAPADRARALSLIAGLRAARDRHAAGERDPAALVAAARAIIVPAVDRVDYVEVRDADGLAPLARVDRPAVILAAVHVGRTRLIDNLRLP